MRTSRKSLHSIMANSGFFNGVTIHTAQGATIVIPQEQIEPNGCIKKHIFARTKELTRENAEYLEKKGVRVFVGGAN